MAAEAEIPRWGFTVAGGAIVFSPDSPYASIDEVIEAVAASLAETIDCEMGWPPNAEGKCREIEALTAIKELYG